MANKKADFKLDDMKAIKRQTNVKNCWFDDKEGLFHCLMLDGTEWTSPTGSAQDEWTRIKTSDFVKADSGKLQWSLLPFEELKDVVRVLMLRAKKYTPDNWKKCNDVTCYKDALMRHVISYVSGYTTDEESGLSHLAHAVCNCLFLMYFDNTKRRNKMLDFNEYQKKAHETASYPEGTIVDTKEDLQHYVSYIYPALGLAEEAGEVAGKFAKAVRDNQGVLDGERRLQIEKELGDVLWFVAELCTVLNIDMGSIAQINLDKLASRKARGVIHGNGDDR